MIPALRFYIYGGVDIQEGIRDSLYYVELEGEESQWIKVELKGEVQGIALVAKHIGKHCSGAGVLIESKWYIIGGIVQSDQSADIYIINLETFECERKLAKTAKGEVPRPMDSHTAVLSDTDKILVFGGYTGPKRYAKLYEYTISENKWREIVQKEGATPVARAGHSAVFYGDTMYVFGGSGEDSERKGDLWRFDVTEEKWTEVKKKKDGDVWPQARCGHSAVMNGENMYIFGGNLGLTLETNDLLAFNFASQTWSIITAGAKVQDAEEKFKTQSEKKTEDRRKKVSPEASPRSKAIKAEIIKRSQEIKLDGSPHSPKKKSPEASPKQSPKDSPRQKLTKKSTFIEPVTVEKKREEIKTPIVIAMNNSIVMKATFSNKRKVGGYEVEEDIENGKVVGNFPCGRDGYAAQLDKGKLYIFGGDRFQMAYNDLYSYSLI